MAGSPFVTYPAGFLFPFFASHRSTNGASRLYGRPVLSIKGPPHPPPRVSACLGIFITHWVQRPRRRQLADFHRVLRTPRRHNDKKATCVCVALGIEPRIAFTGTMEPPVELLVGSGVVRTRAVDSSACRPAPLGRAPQSNLYFGRAENTAEKMHREKFQPSQRISSEAKS